ncbi:kinase-like domain-containing protein [Pisolithus microcarpus]|nr:kinase-like domain-containing protein [Pisolithus microcarpus]
MSASGGNSHGMSINVPFSRRPPDLTGSVEKTGRYPDMQGGYADVWRCNYYRGEGEEMVAVKCIRLLKRAINRLRGEVHIWVRLPLHSHVLPLYGTVDGFAPLPALVSPWAENGTLTTYLGRNQRQLSYSRRLKIILQVTSGLGHLHSSNICHGDLTGSNILIDRNENMLISDFGLSSIIAEFNHTSYFRSCRPGAIRWADPQLFNDSTDANDGSLPRADMKNDIYSMGCIILQVMTGLVPYHGKYERFVYFAKCKGKDPEIPSTVSLTLANLMRICWHNVQSQRPTLEGIRRTIQWELDSQM